MAAPPPHQAPPMHMGQMAGGPPPDMRGPPMDMRGPPMGEPRGMMSDPRGPPMMEPRGPPMETRGICSNNAPFSCCYGASAQNDAYFLIFNIFLNYL